MIGNLRKIFLVAVILILFLIVIAFALYKGALPPAAAFVVPVCCGFALRYVLMRRR